MKALQLRAHGSPGKFQLAEVPEADPGPDEIRVRVQACGLNHLDLWVEEGALPVPIQLPRTAGSEVAGIVRATGSAVTEWQAGDRVAVQSNLFCGRCEYCVRGEESLCLHGQLLGVDRDGGFAEEVVVPARTAVAIPEGADFLTAAALTLAGSTAMHMLTRRSTVRPGSWVLVMGAASGVGSAAIQIAVQLGATVIATASSEEKNNLARKLGAAHVVDLRQDNWTNQVRDLSGKRGVDLIVEHLGGAVLEQSFRCLARNGVVVTCGATLAREVRLQLWPLFVKQLSLVGSNGRTRAEVSATLEWAAVGKLKPVIDQVYPLADGAKAFQRLRERKVLGKLIIQI